MAGQSSERHLLSPPERFAMNDSGMTIRARCGLSTDALLATGGIALIQDLHCISRLSQIADISLVALDKAWLPQYLLHSKGGRMTSFCQTRAVGIYSYMAMPMRGLSGLGGVLM